jgi:hypothetical protein
LKLERERELGRIEEEQEERENYGGEVRDILFLEEEGESYC